MPSRLTALQREILKLLLAGKQNKEIAAELNLPEPTVKYGIRCVYAYFGITHTRELLPIVDHARREADPEPAAAGADQAIANETSWSGLERSDTRYENQGQGRLARAEPAAAGADQAIANETSWSGLERSDTI